jgi:hypothetical protein
MFNMKKCALAMGVSATLLLSAWSQAATEKKEITLLFDLSGSNPLLSDTRFNQSAAQFAAQALEGLKRGDTVILKSFGSLQSTENFESLALTVQRHKLKSVQRKVKKAILSLPTNAQAQSSTNIISWFNRNRPTCTKGSRTIVVTDGLEASEHIPNVNDWLNGKITLPKPSEFVQLKGCDITFYGLGVGLRDNHLNTLRRQWRDYFKEAGATFTGIAK